MDISNNFLIIQKKKMKMKLCLKNMLMLLLKKYVEEGWTERGRIKYQNVLNFVNELMKMTTRSIKYFFKRIEVSLFQAIKQTFQQEINGLKRDVCQTLLFMVLHCLNREKEGYLDIKYIISKHGIDAENKSKELFSKYKKYSSTAYRLKKLFDNK